jgi:hypothetical protein
MARLRNLTIGTAVASFAGVAGFGAIAAISYSGTQSRVASVGSGTTTNGTEVDDSGHSTTTTTTTTTTTRTTSSNLQATATPAPTRAPAQVTTGSS